MTITITIVLILSIGGEVVSELDRCTHLVMKEIALTQKFLLAIIEGRQVVGMGWLEALVNAENCDPVPCERFVLVFLLISRILTGL